MTGWQLTFAAIGLDHRHIYGMAENMQDVGGEFAGWWTKGDPGTLDGFNKRFPEVIERRFDDYRELLEDETIKDQILSDVKKLIHELPADQKEVLMMRMYFDMSFKEIAKLTRVSINTALGRMRYALINIRRMIEEKEIVLQ